MIEDIRQLLRNDPFEPFAIVSSSGNRYEVPTADHAGVEPRGNRVHVWLDNGAGLTLSALHIAAIEILPPSGKLGGK